MECPECFSKIEGSETICPHCGALLSDPDNPRVLAWTKSKKTAAIIRRFFQIFMGILTLAGCIVGYVFGSWMWLGISLAIGFVSMFLVFYVVEITLHFKTVEPYKDLIEQEKNKEIK